MDGEKYRIGDFGFWKLTITLVLASFFVLAALYSTQPLLPVFVEEFDVSINVSSYAMSFTIIGLLIGLILFGFLSDRLGRTIFIKSSMILSFAPFFIMPLTDSFSLILLFRFLQGIAFAGLLATSIAYISEEVERKSVGIATALYISSHALGGMAGRVLSGYITDHYSWQHAFYFIAIIGSFIGTLAIILLPKSRNFKPSNETFKKDVEGFLFHLKNPEMLLIILVGVVLQLSFTGIWTYLPFHLQEEPFALSLEMISYIYFAYSLGGIGSPLAGYLSNIFGLDRVRIIGMIALSIGVFLTYSHSLIMTIIGLCVVCIGFFTAHSLTAATIGQRAKKYKGSASSLYLFAYYIGVTLGTSVISPLWEVGGWKGIVTLSGFLPLSYLLLLFIISKRERSTIKTEISQKIN